DVTGQFYWTTHLRSLVRKLLVRITDQQEGCEVVDDIKSKVEKACPGVVSCADILAIAARDSVAFLGGPSWNVKVGRRDSKTASFSAANSGVIPPPTSTLSNLVNRFQAKGLSAKDMVCFICSIGVQTQNSFDNDYFKNLLKQKGLLHSDQVLFNGGSTDSLVRTYGSNSKTFNSDFVAAMIKMGDISPLTGSRGEIRKNCRKPN
ncbi:Peroxidase, partial [Melia azedarach]